jgi:hypothetical protein
MADPIDRFCYARPSNKYIANNLGGRSMNVTESRVSRGLRPIACAAMILTSFWWSADAGAKNTVLPLEAATMIIEYNASAQDIGVQFFLDSDGWRQIEISDPRGKVIFDADTSGILTRQGGGTELFLESVEPEIAELPIDEFFDRFPEGTYQFRGRDNDKNVLTGSAVFSHNIPAGPELIGPVPVGDAECAEGVSSPVTISWLPVTTSIFGEALAAVRYEVIIENDDLNFDVKFPASSGTQITVSPEVLEPGTNYIFEVLAVEAGGNQTITEGCFTTAP